MVKRTALLTVVLLALTASVAQDAPPATLDIRLSIVETRLSRLESDVAGLAVVPSQLTRIQAQLEALTERSSGNSSVLQTVGLGIIMSVITGTISYAMGRKSQTK